MKKLLLWSVVLLMLPALFAACEKKKEEETKNYWVEYANWRNDNQAYFEAKYAEVDSVGNLVYQRVTPTWDAGSTILMRWYNDKELTQGELQPYSTSYVDVKYQGKTVKDVVFDDSYDMTANGDSIYRSKLSDNIKGWVIALTNMHVGDHCEVIIPYNCGYGAAYTSEILLPYSVLVFDIELCGIPGLEKPIVVN